jgi:hypothetical protein
MSATPKQGNHVFNSLHDLAERLIDELERGIDRGASQEKINAAVEAIARLRVAAEDLKRARNHQYYGAGAGEDKSNSLRYSTFCEETRRAVKYYVDRDTSISSMGYSKLMRLPRHMDESTIDQKARRSVRETLSAVNQGAFDLWYGNTSALMHRTFRALQEAAAAVKRTQDQSGMEPRVESAAQV